MTLSPASRLSFGLASLAATILLVADLLGLIPNAVSERLEARKHFAEALAVQLSVSAGRQDFGAVQATLSEVLQRERDLLSVGLRRSDGQLLSQAGPHEHAWADQAGDRSTATHVRVPIFRRDQRWGTVELRFAPVAGRHWVDQMVNSGLALLPFFVIAAFFAFRFVTQRALAVLDPSAVIPDRVRAAFDTLTEGVLILDAKERIILANAAIADKLGATVPELVGKPASQLGWDTQRDATLPWQQTLDKGLPQTTVPLVHQRPGGASVRFTVNSAVIRDDRNRPRGALVTLDDVSELEAKNAELQSTLEQLTASQQQVEAKNRELELLATRDPLTGSYNRRTLFEHLEALFSHCLRRSEPLCCVMVDIDHFKSVNDRYGHAVGDKVIRLVSEVLEVNTRDDDIVGRYGGEEFCIFMPGLSQDAAFQAAQRLRNKIYEASADRFTSGMRFTASLGVAEMTADLPDPTELVNRADQALYRAKNTGRNRVVVWEAETAAQPRKTHAAPETPAGQAESSDLGILRARIHELELLLEDRERELRQHFGRDTVTGLPNRFLFLDRITQAIARSRRNNRMVAVMSLDIDRFGEFNEALGELGGNHLLQAIAERLSNALRADDTVAMLSTNRSAVTVSRLANDEFGVALAELPNSDVLTWIVHRILGSICQPLTVDGVELYPNASLGVSVFPQDGEAAETLVKNAGAARREAKRTQASNRWLFYDDRFNLRAKGRLQQESQLRQALDGNEFELHYQPRIELATGRMIAAEALLRLPAADGRMIMPGEFIPLAEEAGLIDVLGQWVAEGVCRQLTTWDLEQVSPISISMNVSAVELRQARAFHDRLMRLIGSSGIDPRRLELEITETVLMENAADCIEVLGKLRAQGISIAIDDFGTGYSSLSQLRELPVTVVKIDREFIKTLDESDDAHGLIKGMITMAHSLGLRVTAEGVERPTQVRLLREMECDEVQGYLFAKPLPLHELNALLDIAKRWEVGGPSSKIVRPRLWRGGRSAARDRAQGSG